MYYSIYFSAKVVMVAASLLLAKTVAGPLPNGKSVRSQDFDPYLPSGRHYVSEPDSDWGSIYDEYSSLDPRSTTTTTTRSTTTSPPKFKTMIDQGRIVNCQLDPIECYILEERAAAAKDVSSTETPWSLTTKYWVTTPDNAITIKWVSVKFSTIFNFHF